MNTTAALPKQTSLADIEQSTKQFADAHNELSELVTKLEATIDRYKRKKLGAIKRAVAKAAERKSTLSAAIDSAPGLFIRPRTYVFHGIKVGMQKGKGGITIIDEEKTVELIRKHLPDQAEVLIQTTSSPVKAAIDQLPVADLKRIGCTVTDATDFVVIKPTSSEVDKIVTALLKDAVESEVGK